MLTTYKTVEEKNFLKIVAVYQSLVNVLVFSLVAIKYFMLNGHCDDGINHNSYCPVLTINCVCRYFS